MRKLLALISAVGSVLVLGLLTIQAADIVFVLVALGFTGLINQSLPILGVILGVLLVFAATGSVDIEVNFVQLLL